MNCFSQNNQLSTPCYEIVLQTMAEAVFIVDNAKTIRYCNKALETLLDQPHNQIIGQKCQDIMQCSYKPAEQCELLKSGKLNHSECEIKRPDNTLIPVLKNARSMKDDHGTIIGAVETLTDISALKKSEMRISQLVNTIRDNTGMFNIIGRSRQIQEIHELIQLAAPSKATVLITGDTGTGKELVAHAIHNNSEQKNGPFITVNCSALPENLLESELFGHARGSFTGAIKDKIGRFELADKGTLFLDEIGEVSPLIQVKLLRFLQEKQFERVGEGITRKSDVRIIAATNRDLRKMIHEGTFREDLFYRLKVFPIHVPPLRTRKEDIGLLVDHFILKFNKETGKKLTTLTHNAALTLMDYCWPGNIRELENAIEHAFVTCPEGEIDIFDLPLEIRKVEMRSGICNTENNDTITPIYHSSTKKFKDLTEQELESLLAENNWNKTKVAKMLGIDRTTLWRKMKKFGLL